MPVRLQHRLRHLADQTRRRSYVYGRLTLDDVPAILEGAANYAATQDGIVPWRERPTVFRKQSIARIPPLPLPEAAE